MWRDREFEEKFVASHVTFPIGNPMNVLSDATVVLVEPNSPTDTIINQIIRKTCGPKIYDTLKKRAISGKSMGGSHSSIERATQGMCKGLIFIVNDPAKTQDELALSALDEAERRKLKMICMPYLVGEMQGALQESDKSNRSHLYCIKPYKVGNYPKRKLSPH